MRPQRTRTALVYAIVAALNTLSGVPMVDAAGKVTRCHVDHELTTGPADQNFSGAMIGGGLITFQCRAGSIIKLSRAYEIKTSVTLDGGNVVALDADGGRAF